MIGRSNLESLTRLLAPRTVLGRVVGTPRRYHLQFAGTMMQKCSHLEGAALVVSTVECPEETLSSVLAPAVTSLQQGQPVAIPTETVYGLAANALDPQACQRIYAAKNRPADNPLIVHISSLAMLRALVRPDPSPSPLREDILDELAVPAVLKPVLRRFWPGPLTVLLPKREDVPDVVTAGLETVAVRFPAHPIAQKIIEQCGFPLAAPSANLSGRPSPTSAQHVLDDLSMRVPVVVDAGPSSFGLESTVLDVTRDPPLILRPGSITARMLQPLLPTIQVFRRDGMNHPSVTPEEIKQMEERPATPGMKYRHYSPTSPLILFHADPMDVDGAAVELEIRRFVRAELDAGKRLARLPLRPSPPPLLGPFSLSPSDPLHYAEFPLSQTGDAEEIARNLFAGLRAADAMQPDLIVAQSVEEEDEGLAIMNRLEKAASIHRRV